LKDYKKERKKLPEDIKKKIMIKYDLKDRLGIWMSQIEKEQNKKN